MRDIERKLAFARRLERVVWLLMVAGALVFGILFQRIYPNFLAGNGRTDLILNRQVFSR